MNEFQEQAKNWLRNVVKQNPDKIKAGVQKAGDLIDQQTGGKYAEKVDAVQEKVGSFVDSQTGAPESAAEKAEAPAVPDADAERTPQAGESWTVGGETPEPAADASTGSTPEGAETGGTATSRPAAGE